MDETSDYCGNAGKVERVYWRGEEPWVRMRSRLGNCWSVPWQHTDLPRLTSPAASPQHLLSPEGLLELSRHLKRRGTPLSGPSKKPFSP
jgi:hypothetical protein